MIDFKIKGLGEGDFFNDDSWWKDSQPKVAKMLEQEHKDVWSREQDPWTGEKWKELSPNYREQKLKKFGAQPILRASGRMQDTMKISPTNGGLFNVQTTNYGPYHQFGTEKMAARTWAGIPDQALPKIADITMKNILKRK